MTHLNSEMTVAPSMDSALYCPACGYDLRGLDPQSCPECGASIDLAALRRSQIPWTHRSDEGRIRTFWRTVWLVTFRTKRFVQMAAQPVDYRDARTFQLTLVLWIVLSLTFIVGAWQYMTFWYASDDLLWMFLADAAGACLISGFLLAATGVQTYWLHPGKLPMEQQNRAVALGYYAGAPLAFIPILAVFALLGSWLSEIGTELQSSALENTGVMTIVVSVALLAATPAAYWRVTLRIAQRAAQRTGGGFWSLAVSLPVLWLLLATFWLGVIPGLIGWVGLMFYTLAG